MPHPYVKLEGTPLWDALESAIKDLVLNKDIVESTARPYIVGYLCHSVLRVEKCLRLRIMYDLKLWPGPYPTSEVTPQLFPEPEPSIILMYLADIAGIASHGEKLLNLKAARHDEFQRLVAQSFADQWPSISQKITKSATPVLHQLMNDTEDARKLIKEVLVD